MKLIQMVYICHLIAKECIMIELKDICKSYKNKTVLQHLNFTIDKGQRIAIFGENGCGKTTLLKIIVGQIKSFSGGAYYQNTDLRISALIETPQFIETWSGEENLFYFLKRKELKNTKRYIELFGLSDDIERKVSSYSLGMKQKLLLILALSRDFDLLLLDEPYIALDNEAVQNLDKEIFEISNKGKSVVVVSHILMQYCYIHSCMDTTHNSEKPLQHPYLGKVFYCNYFRR